MHGYFQGQIEFLLKFSGVLDRWLDACAAEGIDPDWYVTRHRGEAEVLPWEHAYLRGHRFDQDAMLTLIEEVLQSGAASGYPAHERVTINLAVFSRAELEELPLNAARPVSERSP